jgi:hypothetical protein
MISYHKLFIGSECNNDCMACPAPPEEKARGTDELIEQVDALTDTENLELCGGEPTLHAGLPSLISHGRNRGARRIKLVTNGRGLAEWDLLKSLVEKGCRLFEVKINGSGPQTHEAVTGARGSFDQTLQGLQNLGTLSGSEEYADAMYVAGRVAVTGVNIQDLTSTVALLVSFGVDAIILARRGADFSMMEAAQMVANAIRVATLNRVWSVCEGFAPCLMKGCEVHVAELLKPTAAKEEKPKVCGGCSYTTVCPGPPEEYMGKRGSRDFLAVSTSAYLGDLRRLLEARSLYGKQ